MKTDALTRTESFDCGGPVELDVRLRRGRIDVHLTETSSVRVELTPDPEEQGDSDALSETRVELDARGRLLVRAPRRLAHAGIAVAIEAPRHSKLKAHAYCASIGAAGTLAGLVAATGRGSVTADDVEGTANVATGSGTVRLGRVAGRLRARLGSGGLELGSLQGEEARITTGSGELRLGLVEGDAHLRTGRGSIVIDEVAGGDLTLVSGSGDLRVGLRPGVAAELDLSSGSGHARSELDVSDRPVGGTAAVRIRMRTGSGEAVVLRAAG
jgi:hypothetical protein